MFSLFFSFRGRGDYLISCGEILLKLTKFCNSASYIIITNKKKNIEKPFYCFINMLHLKMKEKLSTNAGL